MTLLSAAVTAYACVSSVYVRGHNASGAEDRVQLPVQLLDGRPLLKTDDGGGSNNDTVPGYCTPAWQRDCRFETEGLYYEAWQEEGRPMNPCVRGLMGACYSKKEFFAEINFACHCDRAASAFSALVGPHDAHTYVLFGPFVFDDPGSWPLFGQDPGLWGLYGPGADWERRWGTPAALERYAAKGDTAAVAEQMRRGALDTASSKALRSAAYNGHADVVRLLLEGNASIVDGRNVIDVSENKRTALLETVQEGQSDCLAVLLAAGADPNVVEDDGVLSSDASALIMAVYYGRTNIVRQLLKGGATPNFRDGDGYTALMWDAELGRAQKGRSEYGQADIAELLLAAGADTHFRAPVAQPEFYEYRSNATALDLAVARRNARIAAAIVMHDSAEKTRGAFKEGQPIL